MASTTITSAICTEKTTAAAPSSIHPIAKKMSKIVKIPRPSIIPVASTPLSAGAQTYGRSSSTVSDRKTSESIPG
jgi:hypothetical protein